VSSRPQREEIGADTPREALHPSNQAGWQLMRFGLVSQGTQGDSQVYNLWLDPRMKH